MKKLFTKFGRIRNKDKQNVEGTGLGLFVTKQIVEVLGGNISAQSTKHKGSTFTFSIKK